MTKPKRVAACREQLKSQRGTVTAEAAIGMFALTLMVVFAMQIIFLGIQQVRLTAAASEATRIAAASGQLAVRISQAENYLDKVLPLSSHRITSDGNSIHVEISSQGRVVLLPFNPTLSSRASSPLLDRLAVVM
jgi:Flp pilus assembly protein TadG